MSTNNTFSIRDLNLLCAKCVRSIWRGMRVVRHFSPHSEIKHIATYFGKHQRYGWALYIVACGRAEKTAESEKQLRRRQSCEPPDIRKVRVRLWLFAGIRTRHAKRSLAAQKRKRATGSSGGIQKDAQAKFLDQQRDAGGKGFWPLLSRRVHLLGAGLNARGRFLSIARYWEREKEKRHIARAPLMIRVLTWKMIGALEFCVYLLRIAKRGLAREPNCHAILKQGIICSFYRRFGFFSSLDGLIRS